MPNWCENTLEVSSNDEAEVKRFKESAGNKEHYLQFGSLVPMPKGLINEDPTDDRWYGWSKENWGTKWELNDVELFTNKPKLLVYAFDTAWAPPVNWLARVTKQFPKLHFKLHYNEPGMQFHGTATAFNGVVKDSS